MERLERLRQAIDDIVRRNPDLEESRCGFVHLYGVSAICGLLALKRRLDPELCATAGMLHDIWNYQVGDSPEHDRLGALEARKLLSENGAYTSEEIDRICDAIAAHSDKQAVDGEMAELLKDADVFQHYLYNPSMFENACTAAMVKNRPAITRRLERLAWVFHELGIDPSSLPIEYPVPR